MNESELNVSREIIERLKEYQSLLLKWNTTINLISKSTIDDFWTRHVLDSLQLLKFIENKNIHIIDIGSGGGLPGIVLSIVGIKNVTLIECDSRKSAFLLQASKISENKISIINERIDKNISLDCDILTARAFSELKNIFEISSNIQVRDKYLLLKGENCEKEIDSARKHWLFNITLHGSITSTKGKIAEIKNLTCKS